jgi:hypothetical protein
MSGNIIQAFFSIELIRTPGGGTVIKLSYYNAHLSDKNGI